MKERNTPMYNKKRKRAVVNFEMNNGITWFPSELEYASPTKKDLYRAKTSRRWDRAFAKLKYQLAQDKLIKHKQQKQTS